jgi:hypothetical protein
VLSYCNVKRPWPDRKKNRKPIKLAVVYGATDVCWLKIASFGGYQVVTFLIICQEGIFMLHTRTITEWYWILYVESGVVRKCFVQDENADAAFDWMLASRIRQDFLEFRNRYVRNECEKTFYAHERII